MAWLILIIAGVFEINGAFTRNNRRLHSSLALYHHFMNRPDIEAPPVEPDLRSAASRF